MVMQQRVWLGGLMVMQQRVSHASGDATTCLVGWSHGDAWWMCLRVVVSW